MFAYLAVRLEPETNRVIGVCQISGLETAGAYLCVHVPGWLLESFLT